MTKTDSEGVWTDVVATLQEASNRIEEIFEGEFRRPATAATGRSTSSGAGRSGSSSAGASAGPSAGPSAAPSTKRKRSPSEEEESESERVRKPGRKR